MEKQTYRYIDILQDIVKSYNKTPHTSLNGATPASVTKSNEDEIRYLQYLSRTKSNQRLESGSKSKLTKKRSHKKFKFKVGDMVRISHLKKTFEKGYSENWTLEYFRIKERFIKNGQDMYRLVDMMNDPIEGTFYRYELQRIEPNDNKTYKIGKVLKKRRNKDRNEQEILVRWLGWPSKFDSWVSDKEIKDV